MGEKWAEVRHCLFYMYHHDKSFEAPLWEGFPEMTTYMRYAMVYGVGGIGGFGSLHGVILGGGRRNCMP